MKRQEIFNILRGKLFVTPKELLTDLCKQGYEITEGAFNMNISRLKRDGFITKIGEYIVPNNPLTKYIKKWEEEIETISDTDCRKSLVIFISILEVLRLNKPTARKIMKLLKWNDIFKQLKKSKNKN